MNLDTLHLNIEAVSLMINEYIITGGPFTHTSFENYTHHISVKYAPCWNADQTDYNADSSGFANDPETA